MKKQNQKTNYGLNPRELATVLAALRYWVREGTLSDSKHEDVIASDGHTLRPLRTGETESLCERLNAAKTAGEPSMPVYDENEPDTFTKRVMGEALAFVQGFDGDESQEPGSIEKLTADLRAAIDADEPRVVIACDGGLVQGVVSDVPIQATVIDYDTDGADADEITKVPQGEQGGDENGDARAIVRREAVEVSASSIDRLLTNAE